MPNKVTKSALTKPQEAKADVVSAEGSERENLGSWSFDDFNRTVQGAVYGLGSDAGLDSHKRFVGSISKLIRLRRAQEEAGGDPGALAVFVLDPERIRNGQFGDGWVAMLNKGAAPLCGRLWCVNETAACGTFLSLDSSSSDEDVFILVNEEPSLNCLPTIVFDPRESPLQLRLYTGGLCDPGTVRMVCSTGCVTGRAVTWLPKISAGFACNVA